MKHFHHISVVLRVMAATAALLFAVSAGFAATTSWRGVTSTAWATATNWTNGVPVATTDVIVGDANFTGANQPTISTAALCLTVTISGSTKATTLTINAAGSLTVGGGTGTVTFPTTGGYAATLAVGAGILNCGTVALNQTTTTGLNNTVSISTGTAYVNGDFTGFQGTRSRIVFTNTGSLNLTGSLPSGGTYTRSTGTIRFRGGAQNVGAYNYQNVVFAGTASSTKTTLGNVTVSGTFTDSTGISLNAATYTLTIGGNIINNGTVTTTGTMTLNGTTNSTITGTGTFNTGTVTVSKNCSFTTGAGTNITFTGEIYFNGNNRRITNNGTVTLTNLAISAIGNRTNSTWVNAANSTLNVYGPLMTTGTLTANAAGNTVNYTGPGTQTILIKATNYYNLGLIKRGTASRDSMRGTYGVAGVFTPDNSGQIFGFNACTVNFNGTIAQTIPSWHYGNLTSSSTGARTLQGSGWITITGVFTPGTNAYTITNSTVRFSFGGANQTVPAFNYYNLVIDGARSTFNVTLANGTVGVAGYFTDTATFGTGAHVTNGNTVNYNGTGTQTISGRTSFNTFSYNNLTSSSTGARILDPVNTIYIGGTFTPGTNSYTITGNTINYSATAAQGVAAFNYYNLTISGAHTTTNVTFAGSGTVGIYNIFNLSATFSTGGYVTTGSTINYNGSGAQSIVSTSTTPAFSYYNISFSTGGTKSAAAGLTINGTVTINSGATFAGGGNTHTIAGNWFNNNTYQAFDSTGTIIMTGTNITIGGSAPTTFNILNLNNGTTTDVLTNNINVSTLQMNAATGTILTTGSNYINIKTSGGRPANGIIIGTIKRTHPFSTLTNYTFESSNNYINFTSANITAATSITVTVTLGPVTDYYAGTAINRQYVVTVAPSASYAGLLRLHYAATELNGLVNDGTLHVIQWVSAGNWADSGQTGFSAANLYVEKSGITSLNNIWSLGMKATVYNWTGAAGGNWVTPGNWDRGSNYPGFTANDIARFGGSTANRPSCANFPAGGVRGIQFGGSNPAAWNINHAITVTGSMLVDGTGTGRDSINLSGFPISIGGFLITNNGNNILSLYSANTAGTLTLTNGDILMTGSANIKFTGGGNISVAGNITQSAGTISAPAFITINGNYRYTGGTFTPNTGTVIYAGGLSPQLIGGVNYYKLRINKTTGTTAVDSTAASVSSTFFLNTGNIQLAAPLSVADSVTLNTVGSYMFAGTSVLSVGGNFTLNTNNYRPDNGKVRFTGSATQTIYDHVAYTDTFNNVTLACQSIAGTVLLGSNTSAYFYGNFIDSAGTFDIATYTASNVSAFNSDTLLLVGASSKVRTAAKFIQSYGVYDLDPTSTVEYYSASAQNIDSGFTFGNLLLTGASTKSLQADDSVAGTITISAGTFSPGYHTLNLGGNWSNNATFTAGTGLVNFYGYNDSIKTNAAGSFYNLTFSDSTIIAVNITVTDTLLVQGACWIGSGFTVTSSGPFLCTGQFLGTGTLTFSGTSAQDITFSSGFNMTSPGTVNFNGTVAPVMDTLSTSPTFYNVIFNNSAAGGVVFGTGLTANGLFTVNGSRTFNGSNYPDSLKGGLSNLGTFIDSSQVIFYTEGGENIALGSGSTTFITPGLVEFAGTAAPATLTGTSSFVFTNDVVISNTAGITLPAPSTIGGSLIVDSLGALNLAGNSYTVAGSIQNDNGIISGTGASAITVGQASAQDTISGTGSTTFDNLTISGAGGVLIPQNIAINGTLTVNAAVDGAGSNITFGGNNAASVAGSVHPAVNNIIVSKSAPGTTLTISNELDSVGFFTVHSGTVDFGTTTIVQQVSGGTLIIDSAATARVGGTNTLPAFSSAYLFDTASTVNYYGAAQNIMGGVTYGILSVSGSDTAHGLANFTVLDSISLGKNIRMNAGDTLMLSSAIGPCLGSTGIIIGPVERTNAFAANTFYAFNNDSVGVALTQAATPYLCIDMQPNTAFLNPYTGTKYANRRYAFSQAITGDSLAQIKLIYTTSEVTPFGTDTSKFTVRLDSSATWLKAANLNGYTRRSTSGHVVALTGLAASLGGVTECGIMPTSFIAIKTGIFHAGTTWDEGAYPGANDDAEIGRGYTVTLDATASESVQSLLIDAAGSSQGLGTLVVSGNNLTIGTGGFTMHGVLSVSANRTITVKTSNALLDGAVTNSGIIEIKQ